MYMIFRTGAPSSGPNGNKIVRQTAVLPSTVIIGLLMASIPFWGGVTMCIICATISFCFQVCKLLVSQFAIAGILG